MIKVFRVSDLIKYVSKILIVFLVMFIILKLFKKDENNVSKSSGINTPLLFCIDLSFPEIKANNNEKQDIDLSSSLKYAFTSELEMVDSIKKEEKTNNIAISSNNVSEVNNAKNNNSIEGNIDNTNKNASSIDENAKVTEVVNSGVNPRYTDDYQGVLINNSTKYQLTQEILTPNVEVNKEKVVIYHTHTCESYTPTENYQYKASGNYRTIDLNYSVSRVGDELENELKKYGCNVVHDRTYHDYPAYNGSYSRSLVTANNVLSTNPDADIVIDLHRDAIANGAYAPKVKIGDEYVSQLMFVIGSDGANSAHKNWRENLKFAIKVQQKANELYPGLFKPIIFRNSEYNQHVAKAACIIEVGATGNTLEESMGAMKYLAKILQSI